MIRKTEEKPKGTGVYFVDTGEDWDIYVIESYPDNSKHCPMHGDASADKLPDGVWIGPLDWEAVNKLFD